MAGLASIALAVAHLESLKGEEEESGPCRPPEVADARPNSINSSSSQSMPYPRLHGRMVSDDSINSKDVKVNRSSAVIMDEPPAAMMPLYSVHPSSYYQQWYASGSYQPPPSVPAPQSQPSIKETAPPSSAVNTSAIEPFSEEDAKVPNAGPVATLLHKISLVTDDLEKFFSLMNALEQLALPDNAKPAEIPSLDETIVQVQVQRHDVLLGRGGETNHHLGNIQYRQLVKASQPAYLAAKRRDKPRIAAAIVAVVRSRSGRFLKKHLGDHTWRDVGNVRAREKTSQALREGAPELRGTVEAYRTQTQLLTEAVDGKAQGPSPATASSDAGVGPPANGTAMMMESADDASQPMHDAMAPSLLVSGMMHRFPRHHHYHPHHHLPIPMVNASMGSSMYYHHPHHHPVVVYHPAAMADGGLYHPPPPQIYTAEKRGLMSSITTSSPEEPPNKRPALVSRDERGVSGGSVKAVAVEITVSPSAPLSCDTGATTSAVVVVSSAENSEEEIPSVPVRTLSPASSTSSSKVASRGPRIKLLKQRIEDHAECRTV
jgi:hypothetical protein